MTASQDRRRRDVNVLSGAAPAGMAPCLNRTGRSGDHAALLERRDLRPVVAKLEEHLLGVLTQLGRGLGRAPGGAEKIHRGRELLAQTRFGREWHHAAGGADLWVGGDLVAAVH